MKNLILLAALAVFGSSSYAQNFQPATIVTSDGKSVEGEIDYKNWKKNPAQIQFRNNAGSLQSYTAKDLKSFQVSGDRYMSAIVDIDDRLDNTTNLTSEPGIITHRDTVLLRALVTGTKSLYYYVDAVDHFYIAKNDTFELLRYKRYIAPGDMYKVFLYNRDFVPQLITYLEGCGSMPSSASKAKYDADFLKKAFRKYYECKSSAPEFVMTRESEKVEIGVFGGASSTHLKVNTSSDNIYMISMSRANFAPSTNATGGVFFDIIFPRQRGRLSLNNELAYASYETSGTYRATSSPSSYDERTFDVSYAYLKLNNMLRYKFLLNKSAIFVNAGLATGYLLKDEV
ncbi:MAG: PorT family protein [Proteobacteria bacterium]|nr:MAG: PorT family protein [Pseudomonadota bacterium]